MEKDFQTSFIPKKPITEERVSAPASVGLLTIISIFILFTVLLASGGLYFYKGVVNKNITTMQDNLNLAKNRFEPSKIVELQSLDKRLTAATDILSNHVIISPIFQILSAVTMKTVRYTKFSYALDDDNKTVKVTMSGQATGYRAIALQSDLFTQNKLLIDPVFSNLNLDTSGNVLFDLTFSVDHSVVDYKQALLTGSDNALKQ